ncbi:odorant binding protein 7 [Andrena cerasifolii]|uniref:odorant binding protein 7 n=1 Tax=Andrena cerasifolii TaxID=2819439 RepID=UPI0040378A2A
MSCKIAILVCIIACSVTIQAIDLQQISGVLDVPVDQLNDCLNENHLNDGDVTDIEGMLRDSALSPEKAEEVMKNFGCFVSCIFEKSNITINDEIQLDRVLRIAERNNFPINDQTTNKLKDCVDKVKDEANKCGAALSFSFCFLQQIGHH